MDKNNNTGSYNTGSYNTGNSNTGNSNTGHRNTGDCNTGSYNTGSYNTGSYNTGSYNTGDLNTGSYNTGHFNTGHFNTGNYNTGNFNTTNPGGVRLFNQWFDMKPESVDIPYFHLPLTEWVDGKLITHTYHEAWAIAWDEMEQKVKDQFLALPGFDPVIFEEITGINVDEKKKVKGGKSPTPTTR